MLGLVVGARNDAGRAVVTRVVLLDEVRFDPTFLLAARSRISSPELSPIPTFLSRPARGVWLWSVKVGTTEAFWPCGGTNC